MAYSGLLGAWLDKITTMVGASSNATGATGLVPAPAAGDEGKYLRGDGAWAAVSGGGGGFDSMFFSQTSGTFTPTKTGVHKITLKGGGGGGAGAIYETSDGLKGTGGGGGGEGGTLVFYKTLTKDVSYPYVIGAGGSAGVSATGSSGNYGSGGDGGTTAFNGEYSISGGTGGHIGSSNGGELGGAGGYAVTAPQNATYYVIPGQTGASGTVYAGNFWMNPGAVGGGCSGNSNSVITFASQMGAGGTGAGGRYSEKNGATAGADGYILIEYAG